MLAGHVAVGFIGKRIAPSLSLGTVVLAALTADLVWGLLLIAGIERFEIIQRGTTLMNSITVSEISYSHSLLMDTVWAALFAGAYLACRRDRRGGWVLFGAVLSHWLLDFISHRPDMPLAPGVRAVFGLGLWTSIPATLVVEGGFWITALIMGWQGMAHRKRFARFVFWIGAAVITASWYQNIAGPPPAASTAAAGIASFIFFGLVTAWAYWILPAQGSRSSMRSMSSG